MPFTPIHMGPGIFIKALLRGSFSLMIFGWVQILMDIQPLVVMVIGKGHLHGFSHTYVGASVIALLATLTGKHVSEFGLRILGFSAVSPVSISWWVAVSSAFIGSVSHVLLDSVMHSDVQPWYPLSQTNGFLRVISAEVLHKVCLYSGLFGSVLYILVNRHINRKKHRI